VNALVPVWSTAYGSVVLDGSEDPVVGLAWMSVEESNVLVLSCGSLKKGVKGGKAEGVGGG
jgi:hypothetical protein